MRQGKAHKQVWVKVNSPVDEGIAGLVERLNRIDELYTLDSCQGYDGWGWVYFRYGDWRKLSKFVFCTLASALRGIGEIVYRIESADGDEPMGKILFRAETIPQIVSALNQPVNLHRSACSHGRECKEPRS